MYGIREPTLHISKKILSAAEILLDRSERKEYGIQNNTKKGSMGKLEGIMKDEIIRLAKREMRMKFFPLRRDVRSLKITASQLHKSVLGLQRVVSQQERQMGPKAVPEVTPEDMKKARFSPRLIKSLRKHLGVSQREMAKLAGVTVGAVFQWEKGKFEPKDDKKKVLVGLRSLGRREAKQLLAEKKEESPFKKSPKVSRKGKRKA
jgi:DNA-binding transcriptional regulator YiaG